MLLSALLVCLAAATEVVWLSPPSDGERTRVALLAHASGPPLTPADLRAAATRWTEADDLALRALDDALVEARTHETVLDGELQIVGALDGPIAAVGVLRDDSDRSRLFAALAYQGFAVARFWGDGFPTAAEAEVYRARIDGVVLERPWLDAAALEPDREATPYDIAEAPQRVAYNATRRRLAEAPPALLVPRDLPPGARIVVDGRLRETNPDGRIALRPGRHLVHVALEGRIVGRRDLRVLPSETVTLALALPESAWLAFLVALRPGLPVPPEVGAWVTALGGEVWIAEPGEPTTVLSLRPTEVRAIETEAPRSPARGKGWPLRREGSLGVLGGWFSSGDFYAQAPGIPRTRATVNAVALGGWIGGELAFAAVRLGLGLDLLGTTGTNHRALTGERSARVRPVPHVAVGPKGAQLTAGFLFPYHPAVGARLRLPTGRFEWRLVGWYGAALSRTRPDGTVWDSLPVYTLSGGAGLRF